MAQQTSSYRNVRVYRPGMSQLGGYKPPTEQTNPPAKKPKKKHPIRKMLVFVLILVIAAGVLIKSEDGLGPFSDAKPDTTLSSINSKPLEESECSSNTQSKLIVVVLNLQHIWACNYNKVAFSSAVVTGYTGNPADVTPLGNFKIYAKETNVVLTGSDGVTSWHDPVSYWMPFLFNQYGAYGFHDATWRTPGQFGNISTSSPNASHGCVECPLATAKWLYGWTQIGTMITIKAS